MQINGTKQELTDLDYALDCAIRRNLDDTRDVPRGAEFAERRRALEATFKRYTQLQTSISKQLVAMADG